MKKYLLLILGILVFGGVVYSGIRNQESENIQIENEEAAKNKSEVLEIEYTEENQVRVEDEEMEGESALEFLLKVGKREGIEIVTREYDFGVLVEAIGGRENGSEKAWIYFVNEESVSVGAGDYVLEDGDMVEWKYIEPDF